MLWGQWEACLSIALTVSLVELKTPPSKRVKLKEDGLLRSDLPLEGEANPDFHASKLNQILIYYYCLIGLPPHRDTPVSVPVSIITLSLQIFKTL